MPNEEFTLKLTQEQADLVDILCSIGTGNFVLHDLQPSSETVGEAVQTMGALRQLITHGDAVPEDTWAVTMDKLQKLRDWLTCERAVKGRERLKDEGLET